MIRFACPTCQRVFVVGDEKAGKRSRCPNCQGALVVPESAGDERREGTLPSSDELAQDNRLKQNESTTDNSFIDSELLESRPVSPARVPPRLPTSVPFRPLSDTSSPFARRGLLIGCALGSLLGVGSCAGLVVLFISKIFVMTGPVVAAADDFLSLLGEGKLAEAYASAASEWRSNESEATFTAGVEKTGLNKFASVSWTSRSILGNEGRVGGTVTTKNGDTLPISMRLVKEDDKWRVIDVRAGISK